jgi:hypothetical protein
MCGLVFLGLTQETARSYPMNWKRALIYAAAVGAVLFGLVVSAKNRCKPWAAEQETAYPYATTKFGLFSGALWIFAAALFAVLGFSVGFVYSWTVFLFAIAAQVLIQALMTPKV